MTESKLLTSVQIESILDFIKPLPKLPPETALSIVEIQKKPLRKQLQSIKIYPELIPELKEEIKKNFFSSLIQPGESVGIIAAQSISELMTQRMLSSFHLSGQSEKIVTQGVPRTNELLQVTTKPKVINVKIHFNENNTNLQELRESTNHQFICLKLKDVTESIDTVFDKIKDPDPWFDTFFALYRTSEEKEIFFKTFRHALRLKFNMKILYKYRLSLEEISNNLQDNFDDIQCVFSPLRENIMYIFIDTNDIKFEDKDILFVTNDNFEDIYLSEKVIPELSEADVCGISGITNIFYDVVKATSDTPEEWFIETEGSNYIKILGHPLVDFTRTISNNVWDIYNSLGIEASRHFLFKELKEVLGDINEAHIFIVIDKMTFTGMLRPISRYTLKKDDCGVISKASFEESVDIYLKSAFAGESEKFKGVSASIVCGKRSKIGTGMVDLSVDVDMIIKNGLVKQVVEEN